MGSATLYDLASRPMPATVQKGLYIKNGKKYVKTVETNRFCRRISLQFGIPDRENSPSSHIFPIHYIYYMGFLSYLCAEIN